MTDSHTVEPQDLWPASAGQGFLAVLDHLRTWERFDGPVRARIESDGGLTAYTAAAVSIEYGLMQSLPWKGGFDRFRTVAELVNRAADGLDVSASLSSKCAVVTGLATQIHEKADGGSRPYSAASKLFWFVSPHHWTMFDQHAFRAIYRPDHGREHDFPDFYKALDRLGFCSAADGLDEIARSLGMTAHGTRILDKLLMLRGTTGIERFEGFGAGVQRESAAFIRTMSPATIDAAMELGRTADSWITSPDKRVSLRKRKLMPPEAA